MRDNIKKTYDFLQTPNGNERKEQWFHDLTKNNGFLPKGVSLMDIDNSFKEYVDKNLCPMVKIKKSVVGVVEEPMPSVFMTSQRWADFTKSYDFTSNEFKDISLPFITVVRNMDVQYGTTYDGYYNIAGRRNWSYVRVPAFDNGESGVDIYKVPQPTPVDVTFEVRVFSTRIDEQNKASELIMKRFNSLQSYILVNENPMPMKLENVSDESELDLEDRKFFVTNYEIVVQAYLLDEKDFEVATTIQSVVQTLEFDGNKVKGRKYTSIGRTVLYNFKDKKVVGYYQDGEKYMLSNNIGLFNGSLTQFCKKTNSEYEGC